MKNIKRKRSTFRSISILMICFFTLTVLSVQAWAKTYRAMSFLIPGDYIKNEKEGAVVELFWEVAKRITKKTGDKFELELYPVKRSSLYFKKNIAQIHFLSVKRPRKDRIHSYAVILKLDVAMTRKDDPLISSVKELEGKRIGLIRGYHYPAEILDNKKISIHFIDKYEQNLKKLIHGRIDAFVVPENIGERLIKNEEFKGKIHYPEDKPLFAQEVTFVFHKSEEGREIQQKFNRALEELKDGTYEKIFSKYQIPKKLWPKMFK